MLFGTFAEAESKDFSENLDETECAENYGYYSDSDLEEDEDFTGSKSPKHTGGRPFNPFSFTSTDSKPTPARGEHKERVEKGKVIRIKDVAFITYVVSNPSSGLSDDLADSRRFCSTSTPVRSNLRLMDRRVIASRGESRSLQSRGTQFPDRPRSQFIDLQIRFLPFLPGQEKARVTSV